jgi:hypothetical protein
MQVQGQQQQGAAYSNSIVAVPGLSNHPGERLCAFNATVQWLRRQPAFRRVLDAQRSQLLPPGAALQALLHSMDAAQRKWCRGAARCVVPPPH